MCGIIGVIGHNKVSSLLIEGLKRLEYRGYDSAGIATLLNGKIDRRRSLGKIENLNTIGGIVYTGNADVLKEVCPGLYGKIEHQGFCMIGNK